jgi:hypothetical protein
MLITKNIIVKNSKLYKNLGYISEDKYIDISIKDLSTGSNMKIIAQCDYCYLEKEVSYKEYNRNISSNGKYSCSYKCGALKAKDNNLLKYGVESTNSLEEIKIKQKKTILEKYGVEHISKDENTKISKSEKMKSYDMSSKFKNYWNTITDEEKKNFNTKRINTNIKKYGEENISRIEEVKNKKEETFNKKWGGYTLQSTILREKVKKTILERYGVEDILQSELVKSKIFKTNLEKYGNIIPSKSDLVKDKISKNNVMKKEQFRSKFTISNLPDYISYIGDRKYNFFCNDCNQIYIIDYDNYYKRSKSKNPCCTICYPILENKSIKEKELLNFIKLIYIGEIIDNYRDGLEIDIYLPGLNIGFEFNGLYWHSEEYKENGYHLDKLNHFKEKGIRIIHIWEDDWDNNKLILKSQIKNLLGLTENKIFARKCEVKEIIDNSHIDFLSKNHIQGFIRSNIKLGLYVNNELVSLMTFDQFEGRKKMEEGGWNLSRFCNKINCNVIGGASKLLNFFIKTYNPSRIISYADKSWSQGELYYRLGFFKVNESKPNYQYIIDGKRNNKQKFTKQKLLKSGYDKSLTESQIMKNIGYRIYDCGQIKFQFNIQYIVGELNSQ